MDKYQVMPPLTDQEYQELKSSIAQYGVHVAIEYDEEGNVLDGHHRLQACKELGIENVPKIVKVGMSEQQKLDYSLMVNTTRRQLTREQKQELIRQQLKRTPEKSDRQIACIINSDHKTVSNKRKEMESIGEIPQCNRQTTDGRIYPAQRKPITVYQPDENTIAVAKELTNSAAAELVEAVAEGKVSVLQAYAVADHADQEEQREALKRLESGKAEYLMEGLNQQKIEKYRQITPEERKQSEENLRETYSEIDRQDKIAKSIHKAIYEPACFNTDNINNDIHYYLEGFSLEEIEYEIETVDRALRTLQQIKIALRNVNKIRIVK